MFKILTKGKIITVALTVFAIAFVTVWGCMGLDRHIRAANAPALYRPAVIIDAGHGGVDSGASAKDGTEEKGINLQIALRLRDVLVALGWDVTMTREEDISIHDPSAVTIRQKKTSDLHNRMKIMEANPNALFVSIHQNNFESSRVSGAQVFYAPNVPEAKVLAQSIQQNLKTFVQPDNDFKAKASSDDIYLIHKAKSTAVLVECGFMSNPAESLRLRNSDYQGKLAMAIADALTDHIG
ncbi:MAG: N-acetylmuramoyl-L-alanine amidase [Oscillospiraceae bacterium]|jgi:N-acetylmuramoyl-L-alanine amidase|nr:N-acetylmuramoyl-L-alanine amidase [Oscillospiraceae bacterium]